jgi:hypothetical protein
MGVASGARHDTPVERRASDFGCFYSDYLGVSDTITPLLTGGHRGWHSSCPTGLITASICGKRCGLLTLLLFGGTEGPPFRVEE